jgi:prepilin-type N-terminal cleavage/methylation domain-containing protein
MLNKIQKRKEDGFTIIEVLIVLAIAGLIMLVVFLAVPHCSAIHVIHSTATKQASS